MSPSRRSRLAGWICSSVIARLPMTRPFAINSRMACDGRMPVVRSSFPAAGNSPNNPTSPFLTSELDMIQHSKCYWSLKRRRGRSTHSILVSRLTQEGSQTQERHDSHHVHVAPDASPGAARSSTRLGKGTASVVSQEPKDDQALAPEGIGRHHFGTARLESAVNLRTFVLAVAPWLSMAEFWFLFTSSRSPQGERSRAEYFKGLTDAPWTLPPEAPEA